MSSSLSMSRVEPLLIIVGPNRKAPPAIRFFYEAFKLGLATGRHLGVGRGWHRDS